MSGMACASSKEPSLNGFGTVTEKTPWIGWEMVLNIGSGLLESPSMIVTFGFDANVFAEGEDAFLVSA